jgi:hypothetical protein
MAQTRMMRMRKNNKKAQKAHGTQGDVREETKLGKNKRTNKVTKIDKQKLHHGREATLSRQRHGGGRGRIS